MGKQKLEAGLLEDVWKLIRAGRLHEARNLCRTAGQAWRAATLGGCGDEGPSPPLAEWCKKGRQKESQALELDTGRGRQRTLWKWSAYCASERMAQERGRTPFEAAVYAAMCSNLRRMLPVCTHWEAACWAMVRAWLDEQVDSHLATLNLRTDHRIGKTTGLGTGSFLKDPQVTLAAYYEWPKPVQEQQPANLDELFQRLQGSEEVHESVRRECKEPHRILQMRLMALDVCEIMDILHTWVTQHPNGNLSKSEAHMTRCAAHVVLLLRVLLPGEQTPMALSKLRQSGDFIIISYIVQLVARGKEEWVALYASKLMPRDALFVFVELLELRASASLTVKRNVVKSALKHLPLHGSENAVLNIFDRLMEKSRKLNSLPEDRSWDDHMQAEAFRRVKAIQWMCLDPQMDLPNSALARSEICARALAYSNTLFREFALAGIGSKGRPPVEALELTRTLSIEVLVQAEQLEADPSSTGAALVNVNRREFYCWQDYFAFDAFYYQWKEADSHQSDKVERVRMAVQVLDIGTSIFKGSAEAWLPDDISRHKTKEAQLLQLYASGALVENGSAVLLNASICEGFASALQASVEENVAALRDLKVEIRPKDMYMMEVRLSCRPSSDDGFSFNAHPAGGLLGGVMAAAMKGELPKWPKSCLQVVMLEAYATVTPQGRTVPARSLILGLCRLCCLPALLLRCMEVRAYLASTIGLSEHDESDLVQKVVEPSSTFQNFFSRRQLETLLEYERQALVASMNVKEGRMGRFLTS